MKIIAQGHRKYLPLLVMSALFLFIGLTFWLGIFPFQRHISEKADSIQEYYATRENRERQIKALPDLEKQFENIVTDEHALDILLSEEKIVDFIKTLEQIAQETNTGITIQAKDGSVIQEKKNVKPVVKKSVSTNEEGGDDKRKVVETILDALPYERYLRINVIVVGEYWNIVSFLRKMETLPYGLDVISVNIRTRDKEEQKQSQAPVFERNPFTIISEGVTVLKDDPLLSTEYKGSANSLEASFDTVVYLSK